MNEAPLFDKTKLQEAIAALEKDLVGGDGPQISTMRNYRFAILRYNPKQEFKLQGEIQKLSQKLIANGWVVFSINLHQILMDRIRAQGDETVAKLIEREKSVTSRSSERGLNFLMDKVGPMIEGPDGIAGDCANQIKEFAQQYPDKADRTLVLIGRAGALFPFFRSSALLKHLDGNTNNVPVVLLYPGERRGQTGLSFMGELTPDNDYRPRIY